MRIYIHTTESIPIFGEKEKKRIVVIWTQGHNWPFRGKKIYQERKLFQENKKWKIQKITSKASFLDFKLSKYGNSFQVQNMNLHNKILNIIAKRIFEEVRICRKRLVCISRTERICVAGNVNTKPLWRCCEQAEKSLVIIRGWGCLHPSWIRCSCDSTGEWCTTAQRKPCLC